MEALLRQKMLDVSRRLTLLVLSQRRRVMANHPPLPHCDALAELAKELHDLAMATGARPPAPECDEDGDTKELPVDQSS